MFSDGETREDMKKCPNFTLYISFGDVIVAQILSSSIDGLVHEKLVTWIQLSHVSK